MNIILIILCIILLYLVFNMLNKIEKYENIILEYNKELHNIQKQINNAHFTMKQIDLRGSFENDDEVGVTFKMLQDIVSQLDNDIDSIEKNGTVTK